MENKSALKKISRKECLKLFPSFPTQTYYTSKFFYPSSIDYYTLAIESKSDKGNIKSLAFEFVKFMEFSGTEKLVFLGDTTTEWLSRQHQFDWHKPIKEAFEYLIANKVSKSFNGGFIVPIEEVPTFFKHIFWLTTSNGVTSYPHFLDNEQSFVGHICKNGCIHFSILREDTNEKLQEFLKKSLFFEIDIKNCGIKLSKEIAIKER